MLRFSDSMVRCMDDLEEGSRCLDAVPASAFVCGKDDGVEERSTDCAAVAKALKACLAGPVRPRRPGDVGPTPPRPDRSRPDVLFCTPLAGADVNDIGYYRHTQARPAGWEIDSIRDERGVKLYCFRQIPENPPL